MIEWQDPNKFFPGHKQQYVLVKGVANLALDQNYNFEGHEVWYKDRDTEKIFRIPLQLNVSFFGLVEIDEWKGRSRKPKFKHLVFTNCKVGCHEEENHWKSDHWQFLNNLGLYRNTVHKLADLLRKNQNSIEWPSITGWAYLGDNGKWADE